jgi:hypothetical protein
MYVSLSMLIINYLWVRYVRNQILNNSNKSIFFFYFLKIVIRFVESIKNTVGSVTNVI